MNVGAVGLPIDTPSRSTKGLVAADQPFVVAGWAADLDSTVDGGVDAVHIWAYPRKGGDPIFLGQASLGGMRPDVAAVYGNRFLMSGYGGTAAGLPAADKIVGNYVDAVTIEGGAIHLHFGNRANRALRGKTLSLRPAVVEDAPIVPVAWVCGDASVPDKMAVKGPNRTDVAKGFLPLNCR